MGFFGFVYGFLYFYELLFVTLFPFCFVLFFFFVFMFVFGLCGFSLDLSIWVCIYLPINFTGKAGTWAMLLNFFFFFFGSYIWDVENWIGLFVFRNCWIFYVFRVQCWINWKRKLSVWWNDFVSYVWFIDWDDFDIFFHLQLLLGSQKYFVCLS